MSVRPTRPRTAPASAGFSLAEVIVVLTIFGLLVAMAVPRLNFTPVRGAAAGSQAVAALMTAQRAAVSRQHNVVVAVDVAAKRLRVHFDTNNNGLVDTGEIARWEWLPEGVVFGRSTASAGRVGTSAVSFRFRQNGYPAVNFLRNGSASEEGGFYLTSAAATSGESARQVVVERATGRALLFIYSGGTWKTEL